MSDSLSEIELEILRIILRDSHRPSAITRMLRGRQLHYDQNQVLRALNLLQEKGLVEQYTGKAWVATAKAEKLIE